MNAVKRLSKRAPFAVALGATFLASVGCNAILGIDEGHLVASGGAGGGSSAGGASTGGEDGSGGTPDIDASSAGGASEDGGAGGGGGTGTGGASTGGGGGAGGTAGAGGGGGSGGGITTPPGVPNEVHCGTASCKLTTQACCVATASPFDAHCSSSCDSSLQAKFSCDGAEDCPGGSHCCYVAAANSATCANTCSGRVFCGADADCGAGEYCAPGTGALSSVFVCTKGPTKNSVWCDGAPCDTSGGKTCCYDKTAHTETCSATCTGTNVARFACDGTEDCTTGQACCATTNLLGQNTGSACVTGSCPTGRSPVACGSAQFCGASEQCCTSGAGSTCAASCASGTDQVCGNDGECATDHECLPITDLTAGHGTGRDICVPKTP